MSAGQIVIVAWESQEDGSLQRTAYFVAEPDPRKAVEIVRHNAAFDAVDEVEAVGPLTRKTLEMLKLQPGQIFSA